MLLTRPEQTHTPTGNMSLRSKIKIQDIPSLVLKVVVACFIVFSSFYAGYSYRFMSSVNSSLITSEQIELRQLSTYNSLNNYGSSDYNLWFWFEYKLIDFRIEFYEKNVDLRTDCTVDDYQSNRKITQIYQKRLFWILPLSPRVTKVCYSV